MSTEGEEATTGSFSEVPYVFMDEGEALRCIGIITSFEAIELKNAALVRFRSISDKYLECPTLLDRSLEHMVHCLANCQQRCAPTLNRHALSAIYTLCKVRGRKTIQRFLPHGASDIQPVWSLLVCSMEQSTITACDESGSVITPLWESTYTLWNWLNVLSLVPFDHSVVIADTFLDSFIEKATIKLSEAGPIREAAAACLASWYVRPDLENTALVDFVQDSKAFIEQEYVGSSSSDHSAPFRLMGVLQVLNTILKQTTAKRDHLVSLCQPLWQILLQIQSASTNNNLLLTKLLVKWWTRMSVTQLPPRIASWRYQRGKRCLFNQDSQAISSTSSVEDNKSPPDEENKLFFVPDTVEQGLGKLVPALGHSSTIVRWSAAKGIGRITQRLPAICAHDVIDAVLEYFEDVDNDQCWHGACLALAELARRGLLLPNRLKDIVPFVVTAIQYDIPRGKTSVGANVRDAACYTFWAFARAYEPSVLQPFMSELSEAIVLTSLFDREVNCRRAASAAFQEAVGRQGAVNFPNGIAILTAADYFSLGNRKNAYLSISACVAQFREYQRPILRHLYTVKLFHWDIAIRELASHSLKQLSTFDPVFMSTVVLPELLLKCLEPKHLNVRHGSVLGVAEIVLALAEVNQITEYLSASCLSDLIAVVPAIEKKRLYRGRGGEVMRAAVCRLVECISRAQVPLSVPDQVRLLDSVDASIPHPNETIQIRACAALECLMSQFFPVGENGPSSRLQGRVVDKFITCIKSSENAGATRGYTMALGCLPAKLLAPNKLVLDRILHCLSQAARFDSLVGGEGDAETRRNSHRAISCIVEIVGVQASYDTVYPRVYLTTEQVQLVLTTFLLGMEDYTSDRRGDVGSWSRVAAMKGCTELLLLVGTTETSLQQYGLDISVMTNVIGALCKQFAEKLDVVRQCSCECLYKLLSNHTLAISIPFHTEILSIVESLYNSESSHFTTDPISTFPAALHIASLDEPVYFTNIIDGLIMSIGDLTQSITKPASNSLLDWVKKEESHELLKPLALRLLYLLTSTSARVVLPTLKTMNLILTRQSFDRLLQNDTSLACDWLYALMQTEQTYRCGDVQRLLSLVDVSLALFHILATIQGTPVAITTTLSATDTPSTSPLYEPMMLTWLCRSFLGHPFPRIRSYMAEQLYLTLVLMDQQEQQQQENDDRVQRALDILIQTPWTMETLPAESVAQTVIDELL